jgi:hypothetical protein
MPTWLTQSFDDMEGYEALFFEPRSISTQWDLSELLEPSQLQPRQGQATRQLGRSSPNGPSPASQDSDAPEHGKTDCEFEPFPEPRTMPSRWDMTELF